jgi:hypothetical protein
MAHRKDTPPNFIDLKNPPKKSRHELIQDIFQPRLKKKLLNSTKPFTALLVIVVIVTGVVITLKSHQSNIVPANIRKSVNFTVYYPKPSRLPAGYSLDTSSFSTGNHAVLYVVRYGDNQKLVFTLQSKPSTAALQTFNNAIIPLHTQLSTPIGTATIGAARGETFVSLPTNGKSWILMTAPYQTPSKQLDQVLQAF